MSLSIITFADLGKKKNLKTIGIMPVIDEFIKKNELVSIACRTNDTFSFQETNSVLPMPVRYGIKVLELLTCKIVSVRMIEEYFFDQWAYKKIKPSHVVLFHPEYFFQKSLLKIKKTGVVTVGIATMAHLAVNTRLEQEEFVLLNINPEKKYLMYRNLMHHHLNDFDYIIALSDFVKKTYVEAGFHEDKIYVAETDLDQLPQLSEKKQKDDIFRVVYVANTGVLKGLHYLLEAWSMVTIPNKELVIIGIFRDMPDVLQKKYDESIKADSTITWLGETDRKTVLEYYQRASVAVLPSLSEGNPRVVLEAMAVGVPIITTEHARSIVQHGKSGFIVPIRNASALAEKLEFLYRHPDSAEQIGNEARRAIETKKPFGESVFEIYETIRKNHNF